MSEEVLTTERILDVTEDVLRRYGPAKATVVDVARALGVSHGSVYRHFPSKVALREAVTKRWLARLSEPLAVALHENGSAAQRLHHWLDLLFTSKRKSVHDDPELFATYVSLVLEARSVIDAHINYLLVQIAEIITDGIASGEFTVVDPNKMAQAVLYATTRFHNPAHASEWSSPHIDAAFDAVWLLILYGLGARKEEI